MQTGSIRFPLRLVFAVLFAITCLMPARANEEHSRHATPAEPELQLNNDEKWASDASLRETMTGIREVINRNLYDVHTGRADNAHYQRMADAIDAHVQYAVKYCALPAAADAELHKLIAMLSGAVQEMRAGPDRKAGVIRVVRALKLYGRYFSHEGWLPERD